MYVRKHWYTFLLNRELTIYFCCCCGSFSSSMYTRICMLALTSHAQKYNTCIYFGISRSRKKTRQHTNATKCSTLPRNCNEHVKYVMYRYGLYEKIKIHTYICIILYTGPLKLTRIRIQFRLSKSSFIQTHHPVISWKATHICFPALNSIET